MKLSIILVATLFVIATADPLSEGQTSRNDGNLGEESLDQGKDWADGFGGPWVASESQFREEVMEALRSILENQQSRNELLKNLRSESAK